MTDQALRKLERAVREGASEEAGRLVHLSVRAGKLHPDRGDLLQHVLDRERALAEPEAWLSGLRAWGPEVSGLGLYAIARACGVQEAPRHDEWRELLPAVLPLEVSTRPSWGWKLRALACWEASRCKDPMPEVGLMAPCSLGELPGILAAAFLSVLPSAATEPLRRAPAPVRRAVQTVRFRGARSRLLDGADTPAYHPVLKRFGVLVRHRPADTQTREELLRYRVPALAPELEVGERDGCVYLFREYMRGVGFSEWLAGGPSVQARMRVALGLARGLHPFRPLRWDGVDVDDAGRAWLNDSGVFVRRLENHGHFGREGWSMLANGPTEMTSLHSGYAETRAASLSIGAMLVDMFSAQPVFQERADEGSATLLIQRILRREFEEALTLPEPLRPIVARALHRDVSARYPTPNDMVPDLEAARDALG